MQEMVEINGIKVSGGVIPHLISSVTNPDPKLWFRFERKDDLIIVHTKRDE